MEELAKRLINLYPRVFMACHSGHGPDMSVRRELTSRQILILEHLDEHDATTLKQLASHLGVTPATMSVSVDRLVRKGLVIHQRSDRDRRAIELRLSAAGAKAMESGSVLDVGRVARMLGLMADTDRKAALHGLQLLAEAAARLASVSSKWEDDGSAADRKDRCCARSI